MRALAFLVATACLVLPAGCGGAPEFGRAGVTTTSGRQRSCAGESGARRVLRGPAHPYDAVDGRVLPVRHPAGSGGRLSLRARRRSDVHGRADPAPPAARLHGSDGSRADHRFRDGDGGSGFGAGNERGRPAVPRRSTSLPWKPRLSGVAGADRGRGARIRHRPREPLGVDPAYRRRQQLLRARQVHDLHRLRVDDGCTPEQRRERPHPPQRDLPRRHGAAPLLLPGFAAARGPLDLSGGAPQPRHRGAGNSPQRQHEQRRDVRLDRQRRPADRRGVRPPPAVKRADQRDRPDEGPVRGAPRPGAE